MPGQLVNWMSKKTFGAAQNGLGDAHIQFQRAQRQFEAGDMSGAIEGCSKTLASEPKHLGAMELIVKALWRTSRLDEALIMLDKLMKINPYEPGYSYYRGHILQGMGRYGDAIDAMQRCADSDSALAEQALADLQDLHEWQKTLIAEALKSDRKFRLEYARDPERACMALGFRFASTRHLRNLARLEATERALIWSPSKS